MMRSLYSGVSGLKNHQTRMDVVGNNISNVNTTGFKSSRVTFSDTLSQTLSGASAPTDTAGGTNPKQIGLGSATSAIDTLFTDGSVQSTGVNTDLCLSGNGLFIVKSGDQEYYTRNGNFKFDAEGYYVNSDGLKVQGWCGAAGQTYSGTDEGSIGDIQIQAGETMAASATTKVTVGSNLNSAEAMIKGITLKITETDPNKKDNVITVSSDNTSRWSCGANTETITDVAVTFSPSNISTTGDVNGAYAMGSTYAYSSNLTATTRSGDTIDIPSTSTDTYAIGGKVTDACYNVGDVENISGTSITLKNGCVLTNKSNTSCTISLTNSSNTDNITSLSLAPATNTINYSKGGDITLTVKSVTGNTVKLSDANGNVFTLYNYYGKNYQVPPATGETDPVTSIKANISNICYNSTAQITEIAGQVQGDDVAITSGSVVPNDGVTVSACTLTDENGANIAINEKDTTEYQKGDSYTYNVSSMTLEMTDGTSSVETSGCYRVGNSKPLTTLSTVYDSLGNEHSVVLYLTKTKIDSNDGNQWTVSVNPDGSRVQTLTGSDGKITTVAMEDATIQFNVNGGWTSGDGEVNMTLTNGAAGTQSVLMNLQGLTQYTGSNTAYASTDGNAMGTLKSVSIDTNGVITATYTNGLNVARGQIAIAQFSNASGLTKAGNSLYSESNNSGTANKKTVSALGCSVTPSALEMSNVDMASELTDMIVTQRGYQSNSKIITVSDELLETLINMKR